MVQRKFGLQADLPKPSSSSSSHNLQEPNFKKKIKKSRSMKLSDIETLKASSSSQKHDSKSKSSSKLPNYMKSTSSSDARKQQQQEQQQQQPQVSAQIQRNKKRHGLGFCNKETRTRTLTKSSSLRSVRAVVKTRSFKHARAPPSKERSRAALRDEIDIERATCSSTLKNSKFPSFLELSHGGTEAQGTSAMRVCPYLYCSLNGHHHNPSPPLKMFLKAKRRSLKTQKSIKKTGQDMSLNVEVYIKNKDFGGQVVEISLSEGSPGSEVDYEEVIEGLAPEGARMGGFCFESDCEGEDEPEAAMEEGDAISESSGMEWHEVDEEVMSSDQIEDIDHFKLGFSQETENLDFQELNVLLQEELQKQEVIEDEGQCFGDTELMAMLVTSPEIEDINLLRIGFSKETENLEIQELDVLVQEVLQEQEVIEDESQCLDDTESSTRLVASPEIEFINHLKDRFSSESENGELETMSKVDDVLVQEALQEQEVIEDEGQSFDDTELMVTSPETEAINHLKDGFSPESGNGELQTMSKVDVLVLQEQEVTEDGGQCFDGMLVTSSMEPTPESANLDFHGEFETMSHVDVLVEDVLQELEVMEEGESQPSDDTESSTMLVTSAMEPAPEIEGNGVSEVHAQLKDSESDEHVQKAVSEVTDEVVGSNPHADSIADHDADEDSKSKINSELKGGFGPKPMKSQEIILEDSFDSDGAVPKTVSEVTDEDAGSNPHADSIADHNTDSDSENKTNSELKGGFVPKPRKNQETALEDDLDTKWRIGSRRVLEEFEEDTSFNPRESNYLPIVPDQESEKVDLKHQMMDERRSDNEWMLDYVLQQTVTKLAPARKRKVALLVEAFESVLPIPRYEPPPRAVFAHARPIQACN